MNRTETARRTLSLQTVAELRDMALDAELRGYSRLRKAELVELLIPAQLAEMELAEANRAAAVSRETPAPHPTVRDGSLVSAAIRAKETYLEVVGRLGAENGGPAVSIAWEDYLDACVAAETCTRTDCWDRATDGDGRCGKHSHGPALGDDVVSRETVATEFFAHTSAVAMHEAQQAWEEAEGDEAQGAAWEDYIDACYEAGLCIEPDCEADATSHDDRCLSHAAAAGDACWAEVPQT